MFLKNIVIVIEGNNYLYQIKKFGYPKKRLKIKENKV
ncbi:hypothetical protein LSGJ_00684 [Ligilactobacillus salivarius GJ-24]|uniref:Uncharacterized protein n=1 Tax=Ligilactobacillus salivarius GJ-24 TaxID=1041521 RepID=F7QU11_9LACO|nr:hypothetical protein LSGJ_00684 [Ligilactobacillus salivarius GJ-24]